MRKIILFCIGFFTFQALFAQLLLNEISSVGGHQDSNGKNSDWIEVVNIGSTHINLSDYFLSDKLGNLTKWRLPEEFNNINNNQIQISLNNLKATGVYILQIHDMNDRQVAKHMIYIRP